MKKPRLVVVGNGMAGIRTVEEVLRLAPEHFDIAVFGAEPHGNYNRIMLSPVLAGEKRFDDIVTEARTRIPRYTPEWTDLNDNDPGITLVQLFAWMSDMLLYRLGQVPELIGGPLAGAAVELFAKLARLDDGVEGEKVPFKVLVPAFVTSELKSAFQIAFLIFIPFLIIDMIVASVLMSLGMMMLSPVLVALPFKLMLFVLADGWNLLLGSLAASFAT